MDCTRPCSDRYSGDSHLTKIKTCNDILKSVPAIPTSKKLKYLCITLVHVHKSFIITSYNYMLESIHGGLRFALH